jgi:SRSO17 transposase
MAAARVTVDPLVLWPPSAQPPVLDLTPADVAELAEALTIYQEQFAPCFRRAEQRHWAKKYLEGQLSPIPRKSIEPMALALDGGNVQAMQQFISEGAWDDDAVLAQHQRLVADTLGDAATGVLILDGCDFPKQGQDSVGVARQYCGALGKRANCQASVLAAYASRYGYTLVDRRLYLPAAWGTPAYAARREACGVPAAVSFRTKPELAWDLVTTVRQRGSLPFGWVTMDEGFGRDTTLLDRLAGADLCYLAEVPHDTRVWTERPAAPVPPAAPVTEGVHVRLVDPPPLPQRVDAVAAQLPAAAWQQALVKEGSKGPLLVQVAGQRVVAVRGGLPGPDVWLVLRRSLDPTPELKTYLCNASADTAARTLVWLLGMRWPMELAIRASKDELGMDHYEVRSWRGWHHHLTMTVLAHHFLVWQRVTLGEKSPRLERAPSANLAHGGAPVAPVGRRDGPPVGGTDPAPELCCRLRPSPLQSTVPPRFFLAN